MQVTLNEGTQNYLRDTFVPQLQRSVSSSLERAGKGWYNVHESNHATYEHSKLRKLLTAVRFMMEDSLRSLVLNSVAAFQRFMAAACAVRIEVAATDRVVCTSGHPAPDAAAAAGAPGGASGRSTALIALDMVLDGDPKRVDYSDDVEVRPPVFGDQEVLCGLLFLGIRRFYATSLSPQLMCNAILYAATVA